MLPCSCRRSSKAATATGVTAHASRNTPSIVGSHGACSQCSSGLSSDRSITTCSSRCTRGMRTFVRRNSMKNRKNAHTQTGIPNHAR